MNNLPEYNSIFRLIPDEDYLKILVFENSEEIKGRYLSRFSIIKCRERCDDDKDNQQVFDFFLSIMVLMKAEPLLRENLKRKIAPRSRNIELNVDTVRNYFEDAMSIEKKDDPHSSETLYSILETAFTGLRKKLGFPEKDLFKYSYEITNELVTSTDPGDCKNFLIQLQSDGFFFADDLQKIQKPLEEKCPSNWEVIISVIEGTRSREHLSAISINTEGEEIFIHIVNPHGKHIKMEAWKFLLLIDLGGEPRLLYDFGKSRFKDPSPLFVFNNCKDGRVEGMFNPKKSLLHVICFEKNPHERKDTAMLHLDTTYILCLYSALRKLKEDKIRFTKLQEQAETAGADKAIFDNFNQREY
ncbi:MAG: hypothetical protein K8S18_19950 [Desulfobacula sp.]|nr:hypothetical protein [Desulfobacula sp.]